MKIQEVIDRITGYHPYIEGYEGCDGIKCGDPSVECTGVLSAIVPTMEVIRKAIELGYNLIYVHEPSFYLTPDYPTWKGNFPNKVYDEKRSLLDEHGIVIYRDHDHAHFHNPDSIFTGVIRHLGWEKFYLKDDRSVPMGYLFHIPSTSVANIGRHLSEAMGLNGLRYIGDPDAMISKIAIVGHLCPGLFGETIETEEYYTDYSTEIIRAMEVNGLQAIIPGEVIEWNVLSYIRDAVSQGRKAACFNVGHFSFEQLGMKYAAEWIEEITHGEVPVKYFDAGDIWRFM